ncbi:MAG: energy-coupling factor ABC transporter permease [Elusimicrobiota bacterium]
MHIPDGFLDTKTWAVLSAVSLTGVSLAIRKINKKVDDKQVPVMGVVAAFIFAAQMLNFPIGGGTSGHFMGAAFAAIIMGPWMSLLIMTTVLIVQCLVFQDGGLTALGANIFNMGIIGPVIGFTTYKIVRQLIPGKNGIIAGTFTAAWFSIVLAATFCAVELAISGTVPLTAALPAMISIHSVIGIIEGLITLTMISYLLKVRPDIIDMQKV